MAFHPQYWNRPVKNSPKGYNYFLWNQQNRGAHVAKLLKEDPRPLQKPTEQFELDPQIRLIVPAGGIILFSGRRCAQVYRTPRAKHDSVLISGWSMRTT